MTTERTILEVLQKMFPDSSKTTLRQMLKNDRVLLNGKPVRDAKRAVLPSDQVTVGGHEQPTKLDRRIRILHRDDDVVVIDKAAGLLTVASPDEEKETAEAFLNVYFGAKLGESRIHSVHRLDRDSSGVLVFARNTWTRDRLQELFARHDIERIYVAVIHGALPKRNGTFRSFLAEDDEKRVGSVAPSRGKEAITHYRTISRGPIYAMLELTLETGRRNQIRVHLAEAGHPIVGDTMYGKGLTDPIGRLALHARRLAFVHPRTGEKLSFEVNEPGEWAGVVRGT